MKRILLIVLLLLALTGTASAYGLYMTCPDSVQAGLPLKCTVDSDFPPGTTFIFALYQSGYTATEIRKQTVTIQTGQKTLNLIMDTTGLPGGQYKAEMQYTGADEARLRSDSTTLKLITIIDRSSEIEITSPVSQDIKDALRIEGEMKNGANSGIEIEVRGPDGRVFGPEWIQTKTSIKNNAGIFTQKVAVTAPGEYTVEFSDASGYVGSKTFTVTAPTTAPTAVPVTTAVTKTPKATATTVPTPWPTTTQQSPVSSLTLLMGLVGAAMLAVLSGRRVR